MCIKPFVVFVNTSQGEECKNSERENMIDMVLVQWSVTSGFELVSISDEDSDATK